jgi:hypothetical protein
VYRVVCQVIRILTLYGRGLYFEWRIGYSESECVYYGLGEFRGSSLVDAYEGSVLGFSWWRYFGHSYMGLYCMVFVCMSLCLKGVVVVVVVVVGI